ncbi:hypothetical protein O5962_28680, partial [Escherichia coli]|nr:hypothetical protein [Escherichia coli]
LFLRRINVIKMPASSTGTGSEVGVLLGENEEAGEEDTDFGMGRGKTLPLKPLPLKVVYVR